MTDNIEFIAASDLPVAESSEIDVLCVENGELKLKQGASLGSSGYIMHLDDSMMDASSGTPSFTYTDSYDEFAAILEKGGVVWVDLSGVTTLGNGQSIGCQVIFWAYDAGNAALLLGVFAGELLQITCTNGTWVPAVN